MEIALLAPRIDLERFFSLCEPEPNSGCWIWTRASHPYGYGVVTIGRRIYLLHRLAYVSANGEPPANRPCVLHSCDNPSCFNPRHLFCGTKADNTADMIRKRRFRPGVAKGERNGTRLYPERLLRGVANPAAKLDDGKVRSIRLRLKSGARQRDVASEFGISQHVICLINQNRIWRSVS